MDSVYSVYETVTAYQTRYNNEELRANIDKYVPLNFPL